MTTLRVLIFAVEKKSEKSFFAGSNFRGFAQKPRKARKLVPAQISTLKVSVIWGKGVKNSDFLSDIFSWPLIVRH